MRGRQNNCKEDTMRVIGDTLVDSKEPVVDEKTADMPQYVRGKFYEANLDDGSDLYVVSPDELIDQINEYLDSLRELEESGVYLSDRAVDPEAVKRAREIKRQYEAQYAQMSEQDKLFAAAVQNWTIEEQRRREEARGFEFEHTSPESYSETITVLDELIAELEGDNEDEKLLELATTWRTELRSDLTIARIKDLIQRLPQEV